MASEKATCHESIETEKILYEPRMGESRTHAEIEIEVRSCQPQVHPHMVPGKCRGHRIVHCNSLVRQHLLAGSDNNLETAISVRGLTSNKEPNGPNTNLKLIHPTKNPFVTKIHVQSPPFPCKRIERHSACQRRRRLSAKVFSWP